MTTNIVHCISFEVLTTVNIKIMIFWIRVLCSTVDTREVHPTSENTHTKGAQTWMPQKANNAEQSKSFVPKETYF
jgi:hypothetical protein